MKHNLKILTLNAGLVDIRFLGLHVLEPTPYVEERLRVLPAHLIETRADVIALQEVYEEPHRLFLIERLKEHYPYHFHSRHEGFWGLEDSLMFFSKLPITEKHVIPFDQETLDQELATYKGVMVITVAVSPNREVVLYNTRTTAGGLRDPQNKVVENIRASQIHQILKAIVGSRNTNPRIILGDFNSGPETSPGKYNLFKEIGLVDVYAQKHPFMRLFKRTWYPSNPLNVSGPHRHCPPQRIDHIFMREADKKLLVARRAEIVFEKQTVAVDAGKKVTLSDHCGLSAVFELSA
jgi:endonuclease/exonuclease/phosphatase family metal-dependent hydrolase